MCGWGAVEEKGSLPVADSLFGVSLKPGCEQKPY